MELCICLSFGTFKCTKSCMPSNACLRRSRDVCNELVRPGL